MDVDLREIRLRLEEITKIRNEQGYILRDSDHAREREEIIDMFVSALRGEMSNIRTGILRSKIAWKSPVISSLRKQTDLLRETAQRIAWELFPEQFSHEMRDHVLGFENDPFYDQCENYFLRDVERIAMESQKASAEKAYRALLRNMRTCYVIKDPQESPVIRRSQP